MVIKLNKTKSFLGNTKKTDKNGINERSTHKIHREKNKFRKGWLV